MSGFQLQEHEQVGALRRVGTHPKVYKTRWGARLALFFSFEWLFTDWHVVPEQRERPEPPQPSPARPVRRKARNMAEMYEMARWKCERCSRVNEWGTPTCPCNHS